MRRVCRIIVCTLFFQGMMASHSYAWWDGFEHLSGPGPFYGWDINVRVFCLVENQSTEGGKRVVTRTEKASPTAIGAIVGACTVKKDAQVRRLAVDLGARFLKADDNARFAKGERISLTTLEPSVTFNILSKHPRADFIDYAFGAGVYWFSSTEFPSFNGAFLEPVRFEFHPTTYVKQHVKWAPAIPSVRVGYLLFPAGFETASFGAAPGVPPRIGRDWVFNVGVFFDLEGLFH